MQVNEPSENYKTGWIKIYRSTRDKGWYKKDDYFRMWIHLLLKANHQKKEFMFNGENTTVKPGQFITGRKALSQELNINESKVERVLTFFESKECQIEQQKTNRNRLITILNWNQYQHIEQPVNNKRTTSEQPVNTNKNVKNEKNVKNIEGREIKFRDSLTPFVETYGEKTIKDFYDYWREPNRSKSKMRWEQQKTWDLNLRLKKWENNKDRWKK